MERFIVVIFIMVCIAVNGFLYAGEGSSVGGLIAEGDAAYERFDNKAALGAYKKAFKPIRKSTK